MNRDKKRQLSNSAATWLNQHKDSLLPTEEELSILPDDQSGDDSFPSFEVKYDDDAY